MSQERDPSFAGCGVPRCGKDLSDGATGPRMVSPKARSANVRAAVARSAGMSAVWPVAVARFLPWVRLSNEGQVQSDLSGHGADRQLGRAIEDSVGGGGTHSAPRLELDANRHTADVGT